jgi:hypothetical protein
MGSGQEGRMADGTSLPVGVIASAPRQAGQTGSLKLLARRQSSVAFMLCLPLILLISGLVIHPAFYALFLSMLNKKMTTFVGLGNFTFLLKRHTFQLVIFQSCLFAVTAVVMKALLQVGIRSGDIPLGASVSLFMFPILAFAAFFVLRGVTQRTKEMAA